MNVFPVNIHWLGGRWVGSAQLALLAECVQVCSSHSSTNSADRWNEVLQQADLFLVGFKLSGLLLDCVDANDDINTPHAFLNTINLIFQYNSTAHTLDLYKSLFPISPHQFYLHRFVGDGCFILSIITREANFWAATSRIWWKEDLSTTSVERFALHTGILTIPLGVVIYGEQNLRAQTTHWNISDGTPMHDAKNQLLLWPWKVP